MSPQAFFAREKAVADEAAVEELMKKDHLEFLRESGESAPRKVSARESPFFTGARSSTDSAGAAAGRSDRSDGDGGHGDYDGYDGYDGSDGQYNYGHGYEGEGGYGGDGGYDTWDYTPGEAWRVLEGAESEVAASQSEESSGAAI